MLTRVRKPLLVPALFSAVVLALGTLATGNEFRFDCGSVTVVDPGRRTIRLRQPSTVEDGFTGEILGREVREVDVDFPDRQSRLFLLTR